MDNPLSPLSPHIARIKNSARAHFVLAGVITLVALIFFVPSSMKWYEIRAEIDSLDSSISEYETDLAVLRGEYRTSKETYSQLAQNDQKKIDKILPEQAEETNITRAMEAFENMTRSITGEFEIKSINFGRTKDQRDTDYLILPIKMVVNTNWDGVNSLLRFVEQSGNLYSEQNDLLRFVTISDIAINESIIQNATISRGPIDANISMQAFVFKPSKLKEQK